MDIQEIKSNVNKMIEKSVLLAKDMTEEEKNLIIRDKVIAEAKAKGRQNAIEYLYVIIENLLKK